MFIIRDEQTTFNDKCNIYTEIGKVFVGLKYLYTLILTLLAVLQCFGSEGLKLVEHSENVLSGQVVLQLTFDPGASGHAPMTARCQLDHPFYVKKKGMHEEGNILTQFPCCIYFLSPCSFTRLVVILPKLDCGALWDTML